MRDKALPADEVIRIPEKTRERDYSFDRFFSNMCILPHPIAVRAHDMFLETNLGDLIRSCKLAMNDEIG